MTKLEFFFDCGSPWTYLGFETLQKIQTDQDSIDLQYRPILVGGVFNKVNPSVYENRSNPVPVKLDYYVKDLQDWASYVGIKIGQPTVFPVNSVKAMRGALVAMEQNRLVEYARLVFQSYWRDLKDISQDEILIEIIQQLGIEEADFFQKISSQHYKDLLRQNTTELISRGGFGSPTFFLNNTDMYFGNDRLPLIERKLRG